MDEDGSPFGSERRLAEDSGSALACPDEGVRAYVVMD